MSRIGKLPIAIPNGVKVSIDNNEISVNGAKGTLHQKLDDAITVKVDKETVTLTRKNEEKQVKAKHGLYRALINNMIIGVSAGYKTRQELVGVGYKAIVTGQKLELTLGFSHHILLELPTEIKVSAAQEKGKNPIITLESVDKQLLGQVAAKIRSFRKPEPYKGKGIKFVGEVLRRKAGKSAATASKT